MNLNHDTFCSHSFYNTNGIYAEIWSEHGKFYVQVNNANNNNMMFGSFDIKSIAYKYYRKSLLDAVLASKEKR
tara:strand:- start:9012 stop:9230 length:219 start_codon:yes stop_codon:yes gene_type:complete